MKLDIRPWHVVAVIIVALIIYSIAIYIDGQGREAAKHSSCFRLCDEYRSQVIEGRCHCSTDYGWIESGKVKIVLNKMSSKSVAENHKRRR